MRGANALRAVQHRLDIVCLHGNAQHRAVGAGLHPLADTAGKAADDHREQRPEQEKDEAAAEQDRGEIAPGDDVGSGPGGEASIRWVQAVTVAPAFDRLRMSGVFASSHNSDQAEPVKHETLAP